MIEDFLTHMRIEKGCAENTVMSYRHALTEFDKLHPLDKADRNNVREYMAACLGRYSPNTVASRLSTLRSFYRYALNIGLVTRNPTKGIPLPKRPKRLQRAVSEEELEKMVASLGDTSLDQRDRAILLVLFGSGLRVSELVNLTLPDLDFSGETIRIRQGKGARDGIVPLSPRASDALQGYLSTYTPSPQVFPITRQRVWQRLRFISKETGRTASPHRFRAGCATSLLLGGADIRVTQHIMRHSDIDTTLRYLTMDMDFMRKEYSKHPRAL